MRRLAALLLVLAVVGTSCGGDSGVSVEKPWARNSPMMATAGAIYMDLEAAEDDRLIGASVDISIAGKVEIHETAMMDDSMSEEGSMGEEGQMGAMTMREVGEIALPAGTTVNLEPGGLHIMLLDVATPLELGEKFDVTLSFENAGEKVVEVEVREEAP